MSFSSKGKGLSACKVLGWQESHLNNMKEDIGYTAHRFTYKCRYLPLTVCVSVDFRKLGSLAESKCLPFLHSVPVYMPLNSIPSLSLGVLVALGD